MEYKNLVFIGSSYLHYLTHLWCFYKTIWPSFHGILLPPRSQKPHPKTPCVVLVLHSAYKHPECFPACWPPKTHQCGLMAVWTFENDYKSVNHAAMSTKPKDICVMLRTCEPQESKTNDCASGLVVYKTLLCCCSSYFFITPHSFDTPKSNCGCSPCLPPPLSNQN